MKRFIKISLLIIPIIGIIIYSCKRSKLDLLPHGPTEQSYFLKEDDFNRAVLGIYSKLSDFFWWNLGPQNSPITVFTLPGDDITTNQSNEEFEIFGPLQPSNGRLNYLYGRLYQLINRANTVLPKIDNVKEGIYKTPNLKNYHKGEALFLRGYAYYNLWNFFGTAPLVTERPTSTDQFTPPGSTGTQLLDQAIKDFTEAASLLPPSWDAANRGRVTANSANGMLGKSLVFRASATKNAADYTAAITALNKVTGAILLPNFNDNFAWDTENNAESLFEFQASQAFGVDNVWLENDFDNAVGALSIYWGFYSNNATGQQGRSRYFATTKLLNAFNANDPRRDSTLNPADRTVRKYVTRDKLANSGVGSINNYRILRYSDVLLLKAEAILQSNGSTSEAIGLINQVRTRARNMGNRGEPANFSTTETNKNTIM
ncbi:MAG: RagB/SusD family nutrient uptake outer membrane protein, partial [Bacteroidota bacterium]|nr:RagB/SusD family nutrient uptake outer membrane protein [Bacteroidota bacterium]